MNCQGPENYRGKKSNSCKILAACKINTNLDIKPSSSGIQFRM